MHHSFGTLCISDSVIENSFLGLNSKKKKRLFCRYPMELSIKWQCTQMQMYVFELKDVFGDLRFILENVFRIVVIMVVINAQLDTFQCLKMLYSI